MPSRSRIPLRVYARDGICADGMLRPKDAAQFLGVSQRTVERWIARGEIPSLAIRGVRMIPKAALVADLERRLNVG